MKGIKKRILFWALIWRCFLFHKKEIKTFRVPDDVFLFNMGTYKGCSKCDLWRKIR